LKIDRVPCRKPAISTFASVNASSRFWHALDLAIWQGTPVLAQTPLPLPQHDEHEVTLIVQDFGRIALEKETYMPLGTGQVLFLPSGSPHRIDASSQMRQVKPIAHR